MMMRVIVAWKHCCDESSRVEAYASGDAEGDQLGGMLCRVWYQGRDVISMLRRSEMTPICGLGVNLAGRCRGKECGDGGGGGVALAIYLSSHLLNM